MRGSVATSAGRIAATPLALAAPGASLAVTSASGTSAPVAKAHFTVR